jgi:hypothetical protein
MITWCQDNLTFASFSVCPLMPPTEYKDGSFDLVFGGSVLTHLSLEAQFAWMREIWRILAPGGIAVLTFHGSHYFVNRVFRADSVVTVNLIDDTLFATRANAEEGENSYNSFQLPETTKKIFAPFDVLWHCPRQGILGDQDTMVFRKSRSNNIVPAPSNIRDAYVIDLDKKVRETRAKISANGQSRLFATVHKSGPPSTFNLKMTVTDVSGAQLGASEVMARNTREEIFYSGTVDFESQPKGEIDLRFEAVPIWNCDAGKISIKFASLY